MNYLVMENKTNYLSIGGKIKMFHQYGKGFKLKTISRGMMIPWGLSWYADDILIDKDTKRRLVLCIRLPFYWRKYDTNYDQDMFGSSVLRVRFWDDFKICWVPDYQFCNGMINLEETYHGEDR